MKTKKKKSSQGRTNRTNRKIREYQEIEPLQEIAVLCYARGESLAEIAKKLRRGKTTVWDWLHSPSVSECLAREREKAYSEARALTPRLVTATYKGLLKKAESGNFTFHEGVQYLEKTGYLQTTKDKEEHSRRTALLAEQLYAELVELENNFRENAGNSKE